MNARRFTDQQLFEMRNHIPIRQVIESMLGLPSKLTQDVFRFCCPLCDGYNTAVKSQTNLARCFSCEKNFNPIDMVMIVKKMDFVDTVNWLIDRNNFSSPTEKFPPEDNALSHLDKPSPPRKPRKDLVAIGDILSDFVEKTKSDGDKADSQKTPPPNLLTADDIAMLEHIVDALSQLIPRLKAYNQNNK